VLPQTKEPYAGPLSSHIALGSLGRYLRQSGDAFPSHPNDFLVADPARSAQLRKRLDDGRRVIGLSWRSRNPKCENAKSATLCDFHAVLALPGCRFVDLQYGDTDAEREAVERELGVRVERLDDVDNTQDIDGLAALMAACDAVVTVSNTTAHLAGALGRPTRVLVPFGLGRMWCWLDEGEASPWYGSVRLQRQRRLHDWSGPVEAVAAEFAAQPL